MKRAQVQEAFLAAHNRSSSPISRSLIDLFEDYRTHLLMIADIVEGNEQDENTLTTALKYETFVGSEILLAFYSTQQPRAWLRQTVTEYCALFQ